jgi:DNA-binding HxlR family transcriptional regulator
MRSKGFDGMVCSIADVLAALGDRWGGLIVRDLSLGISRYDELRASSGVTNATLADRLKHLEKEGLVERRPYQAHPERHEYRLTAKGLQVVPVLMAMADLGDQWRASGAPLTFANRHTGAPVRPALIDQETGRPVAVSDLRPVEGPGADDLVRWRLSRAADRAAREAGSDLPE